MINLVESQYLFAIDSLEERGYVGMYDTRSVVRCLPLIITSAKKVPMWPARREKGRGRRLQNDRGGKGEEGDARWRVVVFRLVTAPRCAV